MDGRWQDKQAAVQRLIRSRAVAGLVPLQIMIKCIGLCFTLGEDSEGSEDSGI
jgi:hypothetical protein